MSRQVAAVAFDLDGLMFNTEDAFNVAGHELLRPRGLELTPAVLRLMMGRRSAEAFAALKDHFGLTDSIEALQAEYRGHFLRALEGRLAPMSGLLELLAAVESRGLPMAVCTSSERAYLEWLLGQFGLLTRFQFTLAAEDVTRGKPDPEIYLTAAARFGVAPETLMVLEDSENGVRAGAAAGAVTVAVPHAHNAGFNYDTATLIAAGLGDPAIQILLGRSRD